MEKKKQKIKIGNLIAFIVIVVGIVFIIYSTYHIVSWFLANKENDKIKEKLQESIVIEAVEKSEEKEEEIEKYKIDFKSLKEQNNETIGYIKVNNTNIDYVVVQHNDNNFYLKHNFEKNWNNAGWIFADYHNKFDETDKNIVIFGHDTGNSSMFGTLKNTLNEDWYQNKENQKIVFVTEKDNYYYQVFSTYSIKPEDYYISTDFKTDNQFEEFVKKMQSRSIYDYKVEVSKEDKILTLSSCIDDGNKRVVLHAKLMKRNHDIFSCNKL